MKKYKNMFAFFAFALMILFMMTGCKKEKKAELKFETNGGNQISSISVDLGSTYDLPTPIKEGFEFGGWYIDSALKSEPVTSYKANGDITFYAKWIELYKVMLDLDGGTLDVSFVYGKEGDSIATLLEGLAPKKNDLAFYAWYLNNDQLASTVKLTKDGATVKAKYKADYIINVYKENLTKDGYDMETVSGSELVGKNYTAKLSFEGFKEDDKAETVKTITISENKADNVLNLYFSRETYTVTFRTNYPNEELVNDRFTVELVYGEKKDLPSFEMNAEGCYLLGWSESMKGEVLYDAHFIDDLIFNSEGKEEHEKVQISASKDYTLYAIWNVGNKDMFGGGDYVFKKDSETVILSRGGVYFLGELYEDDSFIFYVDRNNLEGKILGDGTFSYLDITRSEHSATRFVTGVGLNDDEKILFDEYNGITYSRSENGRNILSKGTYVITDDLYYVATFTEGEKAGETLTLILGTVTLDNSKVDAFQLRNEKECALGKIVRCAISNGRLTYYTNAYDMTLNGFGTLSYNTGNGNVNYYYTFDEETEIITLKNSQGQVAGIAKLVEVEGTLGYALYDETVDHEFLGADGSTLKIDGSLYGTCTLKDGTVINGFYSAKPSVFGGHIVTIVDHGKTYTFLTKVIKDDVVSEGEETTASYKYEVKPEGYAEYYYKDNDGFYYAPLIVLNDKEEGRASIYGYTEAKTYELILEGTCTYDSITNLYLFTKTNFYEKEVYEKPVDIKTIKQIVFDCDTTSTSHSINIWYSSTTVDGIETRYDEKFTSSDGAEITLVAGIAIYSKDDYTVVGQYKNEKTLTTITGSNTTVYVELDRNTKTFITLEYAPYNGYVVKEDGNYNTREAVYFDGKGGVIYCYTEDVLNEDGMITPVERYIDSVYKTTGKYTYHGEEILIFESDEITFEYIIVKSGTQFLCYMKENRESSEFESTDGTLILDGFQYYAKYIDSLGESYESLYRTEKDGSVKLVIDNRNRYFDIGEAGFTLRGAEYGTYTFMDNQGILNKYVEIDGYGKAKVYTLEDSVKVYETENATYVNEGDRFTLSYTKDDDEMTIIGYLDLCSIDDSKVDVFKIEHLEFVKTFVNTKDWTILKLESTGRAYRYNRNGSVEKGTYTFVTDDLLYYSSDDTDNDNIYKYNMNKGTIVESTFTERGYYTEDLKSLKFKKSGFAIFNDDMKYYYTMDGNDAIIYHQEPENPNSNKYGFVSENFGEFDDVKDYNGERYYINDGFALKFTRKDATSSNYPITLNGEKCPLIELTFTPSGSDTFSVTGTVKIGTKDQSCSVVRKLTDDGYETYISFQGYRFDIDIEYKGKAEDGESISKYEITGMQFVSGMYPYEYLNTYYYLYSFLGAQYAYTYENNLGMVYVYREYDDKGDIVDDYINLEFLDECKAIDMNMEILKGEHLAYKEAGQGAYLVYVNGTDGYEYELYITSRAHQAFRLNGYVLYSVARVEEFTSNGYDVKISRTTYSESNISVGTLFTLTLSKDEEEIKCSDLFQSNGYWYYVVREFDSDENITSTTYYRIKFVNKEAGSVEEEKISFEPYESAEVVKVDALTYYAENGTDYVDIVDNEIKFLSYGQYKYIIKDSSYDNESKIYTVTLSSGRKYEVSINEDGVALITPIAITE